MTEGDSFFGLYASDGTQQDSNRGAHIGPDDHCSTYLESDQLAVEGG